MMTFYYLFNDNKNKRIDALYTFYINSKYSCITLLLVLYIFTPNISFLSNLSGIINGYIFKFFPYIFFYQELLGFLILKKHLWNK